ncbi:uncharacterized protein LOC130384592 isoform X2 [Gadus chalcogrammus]|uniref:uncharacterized protein LOC130384592 isoform X2 n=1 Tax=Gadus chalcogrammus TaxID=1042646 RepID=UPI0024C3D0E5|nr:uncharacterized protein LOC130384592 isoform X2 [Gadus chalcogrammus]
MERSITILLLWCHLQGVGGQSWTVSLPQTVKGLQGSCVRIPCSFTLTPRYETFLNHTCKAQWFKDFKEGPVFDSSLAGGQNLYQGELVGNLLTRNCTTIFHNLPAFKSKLFFRIDCWNGLRYSYATGVMVNVKDVWRPVFNPKGQVEVVEGRPVMLSCSAPILCPYQPTLSWTPSLGDTQETVEDELVTSVLTFNASALHHRQRITCSSLYKRHTGLIDASFKQYLTINVLYRPDNVSVEWPSSPVLEGSYVRLSCKGSANPPADLYAWYRSRLNPGTDQGPSEGPLGFSRSINVSVSADAQYFCEVGNPYGAKNTSLTQMVVHSPPRILPSSGCSRIAAWVRCSCDSVGRPSPSLEWRLDGKLVSGSKDVSVSQVNLDNTTSWSTLTIKALPGPTALTCHSSNAVGNTSQKLPVSHLDTQPNLTDLVLCTVKSAVMFVGLVCVVVCIIRNFISSPSPLSLLEENMTGSWRLFLLCSLLLGAGCNAAVFEALMPASVMTLSGSCVTVPCSFTVRDGFDDWLKPECGKYWYKIKYQPISSTTFRGDLTAYNCTTTFNNVHEDNVQYYFRIECHGKLKYQFYENPVTIRIKGLPDAPRLTPPKEPVVEGTPVELGCSAPSYCDTHPPTVTWTPALGLSTQLQQNDTVTSTLTFNASHLHHGNNVSCTAAYYTPSGNKTVTSTRYQLSISYAPRNTSAVGSPCLPAREEGCLNLTCTSHANPAVSEVIWYRIHGEHILKIGSGSPLSIQLWNANDVFFCVVRNDIGIETSNIYKIDFQTPPRILPSSACSRIAAWVRCSCYSVGRPSPSLEWWLDGKLVLGSEDVSVSQVSLENATLRSSLTMRAPAGPTALTCHSSNAAGNTSQKLPVPHLDTQPNLTDLVLCIVKSAVIFVGLVCVVVCIIRTRKVGEETRSFNAATVKRAPPDEEESQVVFGGEGDIYVNNGMQMNPVGPREEPVGPREEAVLRAGSPVSTHHDAASSHRIGPAGSHTGRPVSRELTEDTQ